MDLDRASLPHGVDLFVCFALHVDAIEGHLEEIGQGLADGVFVWAEFGSFADDGGVEVGGAVAEGVDSAEGFGEENARVLRVVAGVGVWEELADVWVGDGSEERVGDGVEEGVAIGVGDGASVVLDGDGAEDEGASGSGWGGIGGGFEAVEVVAVADADGWMGCWPGGWLGRVGGRIGVGRCSHRAILPITVGVEAMRAGRGDPD